MTNWPRHGYQHTNSLMSFDASAVLALGNERFQHLTFMIHGTREIAIFAIDRHEQHIGTPTSAREDPKCAMRGGQTSAGNISSKLFHQKRMFYDWFRLDIREANVRHL